MRRALTTAAGSALLATALLVPGAAAQSPEASPAASPAGPGTGVDVERHPAHIHAGTCANLGDIVAPLPDVRLPAAQAGPEGGVESSLTRVDLTIEQMLAEPHAINAHLSEDEIGTYIACGDITGRRADRNLVIQLREQNGSGYRGIALIQETQGQTIVFTALFAADEGIDTPEPPPSAEPLPSVAPLPSIDTEPSSPDPSIGTDPSVDPVPSVAPEESAAP